MVRMSTWPDDDTQPLGRLELPGPGYTALFGVPAVTLNRLRFLRGEAEELRMSLADWRREFDTLLDGAKLPPREQLDELRDQVTTRWLKLLVPKTRDEWADSSHLHRLLEDLAVLEGPPTLTDVRQRLDQLPEARAWARHEPNTHRDQTLAQLMRHERYLREWLRQLDPHADAGPVDEVTGLPQQLVERRRFVDDEVLGRVPVSLTEARARAYVDATAEERNEADFWQEALGGLPAGEASWKLRLAQAELTRVVVVDFLRFAHEHDSPTGEAMRQLWEYADLRDLLEEYLDR